MIAVVLLVVVLAIAAVLYAGSRRRRPRRDEPRTVADLVRLRGAAAPAPPAAVEAVPGPAAADEVPERPADVPTVETGPVDDGTADADRNGAGPAAGPDLATDFGVTAASADTPWARAARMRGDGATAWLTPPARSEAARTSANLDSGAASRANPARPGVNGWPPAAPVVDTEAVPSPAPDRASDRGRPVPPVDADATAADQPTDAPPVDPDAGSGPDPAPAAALAPAASPDPAPDAVDLEAPAAAAPDVAVPAPTPPEPGDAPRDRRSTGPSAAGPADPPHAVATRRAPAIAVTAPPESPVPTPARTAGRLRRSPAETAAEQAAADLALLRTFGVAGPGHTVERDDAGPELAVRGPDPAAAAAGAAQPVAFRVVGRGGAGIGGAVATLHDDRGRATASAPAGPDGRGLLLAPHPGGFVLVTAADGHQPGAAALTVTDGPVDVEVLLTRAASISGTVAGEAGPQVGAHVVLVQDGETLDTTETDAAGGYRFADLAAGEYGLSVTAEDCERAVAVVRLADEEDARRDVDLLPAGLPA